MSTVDIEVQSETAVKPVESVRARLAQILCRKYEVSVVNRSLVTRTKTSSSIDVRVHLYK